MKILLIAGHGAGDNGAVANGYREADLTRELVTLIKGKLAAYADVDVFDMAKDAYKYIKTNVYNFKPYDYVLEVHFNAGVADAKGDGKTTGTEIYVTTAEKTVSAEEAIINNIAALGFANRGVKRKNFDVINTVKKQGVSAALLEVCFISDKDDITLYQKKKNEVAIAIVKGIIKAFKLKDGGTMAAFTDIKGHYAEKYINDLKNMGIINGNGDGTFKPNNNITRGDAAIMIRNAIRYITGK